MGRVFSIKFRLMSRLEDLQWVQQETTKIQPRACGCVHELISASTGVDQFCPLSIRESNALCQHRSDARKADLTLLVGEAARLNIISPTEERTFLRFAQDMHRAVLEIDDRALGTSEELADAGELIGITDFTNHWLAQEVRDRQRGHAEEIQEVLSIIRERAIAAINSLKGAEMAVALTA